MDRGEQVAAGGTGRGSGVADLRCDPSHQVLHHVPDEMDAVSDPLGAQVRDGGRRRRERPAREVIGDDPVRLLGHPPVERPQPGLDVRDRDAESRPRQRAGERRVRVADNEHGIGLRRRQHRLEREQHAARLLEAAATSDAKRMVRLWQRKLAEEGAGHRLVPVLAGVDEDVVVPASESRPERRELDQLRTGADDGDDAHAAAATS